MRYERQMVLACSANVEKSFSGEIEGLPLDMFGRKHLVRDIRRTETGYIVTLADGTYCFASVCGHEDRFASGSSVNILRAWHSLGLPPETVITVVAPFNPHCKDGIFLKDEIIRLGARVLIFPTGVMPTTLSVRGSMGTTLFCKKADYPFSPESYKNHLPKKIHLAVLTGIKPADVLLTRMVQERAITVACMPHKSFLSQDKSIRDSFLGMARHSFLLQMNEEELAMFCTNPALLANRHALCDSLQCDRMIVTRSAQGAMLLHHRSMFDSSTGVTNPVDTSGAGDAHFAAYLYFRFIAREVKTNEQQLLEIAAHVAGISVMHRGPCNGIPRAEDLPPVDSLWDKYFTNADGKAVVSTV